jgi:menaquinone-dependent protoporphyrinogen oxidase
MANVLVVYATREGQTRKVAERIATTLRSSGHAVELLDVEGRAPPVDLSRFQAIAVGSPVRANGYLRSVARFVREHRPALQQTPSAFFSVGLAVLSKIADGRAQTLELVEKFMQQTGWRPRRVELIAGALPWSKYGFLVRFAMKRIVRKEGGDTDTSRDYEYTDWPAVDAFAREFVAAVVPAIPAPRVPVTAPAMPQARA